MVDFTEDNEDNEEQENEELYEHIRLEVDKGQNPLRIDKFISNRVENLSRNRVQNASKADALLVNGEPVKVNYKVKPKDIITIVLPRQMREFSLSPEQLDLDIVFEDDSVLVVNKPAGMVVHPGTGNWSGTLAHGLAYHIGDLEERGLDPQRPGIIHRIDKFTSGLLVVGKNDKAITHLSNQFFEKSVQRIYDALVWGNFEESEGTIHNYIGRSQNDRKIFEAYDEDEMIGKEAITHYRVIDDFGYVSRIECKLETGRTHQIRVHMKHLNHPIFADHQYGGDKIVKGTVFSKYKKFVENCFKICNRQALHAKTLGFVHPVSGKELHFEAELPEDMQQVMEKWRNYSQQLKR